jgi:hypothetical protein
MNLEHTLSHQEVEQLHHQLQLLAHSCLPLLHALEDTMKHASAWNARINGDRSFMTRKKELKRGPTFEAENERVVERLRKTIAEFNTSERLEVIEPYKVRCCVGEPPLPSLLTARTTSARRSTSLTRHIRLRMTPTSGGCRTASYSGVLPPSFTSYVYQAQYVGL